VSPLSERQQINNNGRDQIQALTASSMKMRVFYDIAPCSLVEVYRRFRCAVVAMSVPRRVKGGWWLL
jgi:hypothetical protein